MYRQNALARTHARKTITRETHGIVIALHADGIPDENKNWHFDLRRGRLNVFGALLRFIDACIKAGKPELADQTVAWIAWYVEDQKHPTNTTEIKLAA